MLKKKFVFKTEENTANSKIFLAKKEYNCMTSTILPVGKISDLLNPNNNILRF